MFLFFFPSFKDTSRECGARKTNRDGSDHRGRKVMMFLAEHWRVPCGGGLPTGATEVIVRCRYPHKKLPKLLGLL